MKFENMSLSAEMLKAIKSLGFEEASPIQVQSIKPILNGKDIIGQAQTGTGKTAAFGIPLIEKIDKSPFVQALVLCPTRELSIQVAEELSQLSKYKKDIKILPVYGGTNIDRQMRNLRRKVNIVVGTPGRVMDLMRRKALKLDLLKIAVLDEADEMFDMGFRDDMKTILEKTNPLRQTCFYSATMDKEIMEFSALYQKNPEIIRIKHKEVTVEKIDQYYLEMAKNMKEEILTRLIDIYDPKLSIVFCNTKKMVDDLVNQLSKRGYLVDGLHGDLKQNQRDLVMKKFRQGRIEILVATDVAARGIDVGNVDVVFNYDLPQDEEYYVHRIGRTARAGRKGKSFTFVVGRDIYKLKDIIKYTKAEMEFLDLPTIDNMDQTKAERFIEDLNYELENWTDNSQTKLALDLLIQKGHNSYDIAGMLLEKLYSNKHDKKHVKLDQVDYGEKYYFDIKNARRKGKANKARGSRIFINKGKRDGLNPGNILAAIHQETNISKEKIGNILIKSNFSFVEVPDKYLDKIIKGLNGKKIRGKKVEVEKSQG